MEETFKIGRRGFAAIVVSLMVAAVILRIKWPDINVVSSVLERILIDKLMMRVVSTHSLFCLPLSYY